MVPLIIKSFLTNKGLPLTEGNQKLAFTYVDDIVNAYIMAINYLNREKNFLYNAFNIGSNRSYSLKKVVAIIKTISKKPSQIKFGKIHNAKDEKLDIHCDSRKAKAMLKWSAKTDIISGLKNTYSYYKNLFLV